jgi:carboxypeptidase PM20D1
MKKVLLVLGLGFLILVAVLLVRTARFTSRQVHVEPAPAVALDADASAARLADALRHPTLSHLDPAQRNEAAFAALNDFLIRTFPRVHETLSREVAGECGVLYTWHGSDSGLKPILLMGHVDVVPVEPGTEEDWEHPPFAGEIADGYVWGRGAIDNKSTVLALLEAVEVMLGENFQPVRTVYLAFGQDEEVGGHSGAAAIVDLLDSRGVGLEYVLDEGAVVLADAAPLNAPVALVGIAEKGYLSLALSVEVEGGHSSMPPRQTAVGILSSAVAKLQDNPFPGGLRGPTRQYLSCVGRELSFFPRMVFANTWLFGPLIERQLAASPSSDALLRTTTAPTMFEGSIKDNVLPGRARAVVNFRIYPGETVESVTDRVQSLIDDPRVQIEPFSGFIEDPSPVSPTGVPAFGILQRTIRQVFSDVVVAPFLTVVTTDSRHYHRLTENVYRFQPVRLLQEDLPRIHGTNERISIESYAAGIRFFRQLILNSDP